MKRVVDKHNLWPFIKLNHLVKDASWDDEAGNWIITIEDTANGVTFTDTCDISLMLADHSSKSLSMSLSAFDLRRRFFSHWEWPKIAGINDFEGTIAHTANYPELLGRDLRSRQISSRWFL